MLRSKCSGTDWALAVVSIVPVGRAGALLFRVGRACFCVTGDTLVATPDGLVPIAEIEIGDLVLAVDPETGEVAAKPVTALIRPPPQPTYALQAQAEGGGIESFRASAEHPWRVAGRGWVNTQDLRAGDELQTASGATLTITSLALSRLTEQTYTLEVAGGIATSSAKTAWWCIMAPAIFYVGSSTI